MSEPVLQPGGIEKEYHTGVLNEKLEHGGLGLSGSDVLSHHVEASAVDEVYARKVYVLNKIINEHIGMTWWHYGLFLVCGVGWFLDNAWLQLVAIILPQVKNEFFPGMTTHEGFAQPRFMTLSVFAGMLVGAAFWGVAADIVGRRFSFNATLLLAAIFGTASGGATSFTALGGLFGALCFGLGGALPVDGMLLLEFLPGNRQNLLAGLSVFWSLGQLIASLIAWGLVVKFSCDPEVMGDCLIKNSRGWVASNASWRYLIFIIGGITFFCFFLRFIVFRIPESPKYFLAKGRDAEAVDAMHRFAKMCGRPLPEDMLSVSILRSAAGQDEYMDHKEEVVRSKLGFVDSAKLSLRNLREDLTRGSNGNTRSGIKALFATRQLGYTTAMIWLLWAIIGLAYPLFSSFIVLYLGDSASGPDSTYMTYRNYAIVSVCGVPGSIIAAFLVEIPRSGRRGALMISTLLSGVFLFGFTGVHTPNGSLAFSCLTTFFQNIMYGVLYCYTPESFPAPLRGTADGISASLNRITGMVAVIVAIYGSSASPSAPIYISAALFIVAALLMLTLRVETSHRTAL